MNNKEKLKKLVINGDFESITNLFEINEKRLDKILKQSDHQLLSILKLNTELEDYKSNLEKKVVEETQKRVEQEKILMQSSKMAEMGNMLEAIIHQWKQPITVINMTADIISKDIKSNNLDNNTLEKDIDNIKDKILLLSNTIDDFRNFFKPDKEIKEFFVKNLIKDILRVIDHQILKLNASISISDLNNISIFGFENEIKHVILNIINNALEACNKNFLETNIKPLIDIKISEDKDMCLISIEDNGGGIPHSIMEKLFTPYNTSKGENGTGIGLVLAKTIIEDHHKGKIVALNSNNGAIFKIFIPKKEK